MITSPSTRSTAHDAGRPQWWPEPPDFGAGRIAHGPAPLGPRELFCHVFTDPEDHAQELEPLFHWAIAALDAAPLPVLPMREAEALVDGLCEWAQRTLMPTPLAHHAPSWPVRIAREFGPAGLSDGTWLRGALRSPRIDGDLACRLLQQFEVHFGDPERSEGRAERYAMLLESVGVPPASLTRWEAAASAPCTDVSYEHALLGLALGTFPAALWLEMLGYNLWATCIGPAPLLGRLLHDLRAQGADVRYLEAAEAPALRTMARELALASLRKHEGPAGFLRLARGFAAAHASHQRWEQAMLGPNVPFTPWDCVVDMVRRKARFAAEHHTNVVLGKRNVEQLMLEGEASHEWLVDRLRSSPLIRPGDPSRSRFLTHSLSIDGPMFDAFTPREKADLSAWIASIGTRDEVRTRMPRLPLRGVYGPAQDADSFEAHARRTYGRLDQAELYQLLASPDEHPALALFVRRLGERWVRRLEAAFSDARLESERPPAYSIHDLPSLLASSVARTRIAAADSTCGAEHCPCESALPQGGAWLQGFSDVRRAAFDDYRWAFRSHVRQRRAVHSSSPVRLEGGNSPAALIGAALALNTSCFVPELLAIEAAAAYARCDRCFVPDAAAGTRAESRRLALAALRAFIRRVSEAAPAAVDASWSRVWRTFRALDLAWHGREQVRALISNAFSLAGSSAQLESASDAGTLGQ
jgi:hypothetical protein